MHSPTSTIRLSDLVIPPGRKSAQWVQTCRQRSFPNSITISVLLSCLSPYVRIGEVSSHQPCPAKARAPRIIARVFRTSIHGLYGWPRYHSTCTKPGPQSTRLS